VSLTRRFFVNPGSRFLLPALAGGVVAVLDMVSKRIVQGVSQPVSIVRGVSVQPVANAEGPFGSLSLGLTLTASAVVLLFLFLGLRGAGSRGERLGIGLVLGGGTANFIERVTTGQVTDIFLIHQVSAWNVSDIAVLLGVVGMAGSWFVKRTLRQTRS